jgi:hypothetical protein
MTKQRRPATSHLAKATHAPDANAKRGENATIVSRFHQQLPKFFAARVIFGLRLKKD